MNTKEREEREQRVVNSCIATLIYIVLGALFWPLAINPWLVFFGKTAKVLWWHGALLGCIRHIRHWCIMAAIFTAFVVYLLED